MHDSNDQIKILNDPSCTKNAKFMFVAKEQGFQYRDTS
jgi:hypothetical protein